MKVAAKYLRSSARCRDVIGLLDDETAVTRVRTYNKKCLNNILECRLSANSE